MQLHLRVLLVFPAAASRQHPAEQADVDDEEGDKDDQQDGADADHHDLRRIQESPAKECLVSRLTSHQIKSQYNL